MRKLKTSALSKSAGSVDRYRIMSWTDHVRNQTKLYWYVHNLVDHSFVKEVLSPYSSRLSVAYPAVSGSQVMLAGMAMVYALRGATGQLEALWNETHLRNYNCPTYPGRYVAMALMDQYQRSGKEVNFKTLPPNLTATAQDVEQLIYALSPLLPKQWSVQNIHPRSLHPDLPANGNLIANDTYWKVKTSSSRCPVNMDLIVQCLGYWCLHPTKTISILLPRHQRILTINVKDLVGGKKLSDAAKGFVSLI